MKIEEISTDLLLDYFAEEIICESYCPCRCNHDTGGFNRYSLREEIDRRIKEFEVRE